MDRPNAYAVLVSEIMLQQTTVETVKPRFLSFMRRFPDLNSLARAPLDDVLHEWQGLGYYRRARSLHAAAIAAVRAHGGNLPEKADKLETLPGIGNYTSAAIAAIAFRQDVVPVDGNIARIVSRLARLEALWPSQFSVFQNEAERFRGSGRPADMAQALMDLGAMICRPKNPACLACPLSKSCNAHILGNPEDYPKKVAKKAKKSLSATAFMILDGQNRIQLRKRPENGLLSGLVELPSTPWRPICPDDPLEVPSGITGWRPLGCTIRHVFTHIDLKLDLALVLSGQAEDGFWHSLEDLKGLALPSMTKKALKAGLQAIQK